MTDQFCMCGAQPGYPHQDDCPFPLYRDGGPQEARWYERRDAIRDAMCNPAPDLTDPAEGGP